MTVPFMGNNEKKFVIIFKQGLDTLSVFGNNN